MSQTKVQLIAPIGVVTASTLETTGILTATTFVGDIAGTVTGITSTTDNLNLGIITATSFAGDFTGIGSGLTGTPNVVAGVVTATKFVGNTPGTVSGIADGTNINAGIITATSFVGNLTGNAAGLSTTTANLNLGIVTATSFAGNFTGVASGITGTPNIVVGIMTGTLNGDGSSLTGIAATNWIANNVTANSSTTTIDLSNGNTIKFTQTANTTVSFANTGTSNILTFIRDNGSGTITWPSSVKWTGGLEPTILSNPRGSDYQVFTLLTRDEGVTWYAWEDINYDPSDKALMAWGSNNSGIGGYNLPGQARRSSPVQVPGTNWSTMANHGGSVLYASFGVKTDGTLWSWGSQQEGGDILGVLGQNGPGNVSYSSPIQIGSGTDWSITRIGYKFVAALKTDGTLWTWGKNDNGQLGVNNRTQYSSPVQVPGTTWSTMGCVAETMWGIKTDGTLWSWGTNGNGRLAVNQPTSWKRSSPVQVPGTTWSIVDGGAAWSSAGAVKTDGTLWMWGSNTAGQLGQGNTTEYSSPKQVGSGTDWANMKISHAAVRAVKTDGTLWSWGINTHGQLGLSNKTQYSSPVQVPGTTWSTDVDALGSHTYSAGAVKTDGTLWMWGQNSTGELGQNNRTEYSSPRQIPGTAWTSLFGQHTAYKGIKLVD